MTIGEVRTCSPIHFNPLIDSPLLKMYISGQICLKLLKMTKIRLYDS